MPQIETLIEDIYKLFEGDISHFNIGVSRESKDEDKPQTLRMSNLGKPLRQLYYDLRGTPNQEKLSGKVKFKFEYGNILESLILSLAKQAGHSVTDEQKEVSVDDVPGHIDAIVDECLIDVKSCSPYSFQKFKNGSLYEEGQDPFAYLTQLSSYLACLPEVSRAFFLAVEKVSGELCLLELRDDYKKSRTDVADRIATVREAVNSDDEPVRCAEPKPDGTSGNLRLPVICSYCVIPETPILKSDLSWTEAGNIISGDSLIGFDEPSFSPNMLHTKVLGVGRYVLPLMKVYTNVGDITVSKDHMFVSSTEKGHLVKWREARTLSSGCLIKYFGEPWLEDISPGGLYLRGFLDGEGCWSNNKLSWSQNPGPVSDHVNSLMDERGFNSYHRYVKPGSDCIAYRIKGSFYEGYRSVGTLRPLRILPKAIESITKLCARSRLMKPALVLGVEEVGNGEVIAIETDSETLITNGFFSHNCSHKFWCHRDANDGQGVFTYLYSDGPRFLTTVKREPKVTRAGRDIFPTKEENA